MHQGVVQSSPVQQMVVSGNPNWWSINNMTPPSHHQHHSFPHQLAPAMFAAAAWNDSQELPEPWSQLLLGGLVGEEDEPALSLMLAKKLENLEQKQQQHVDEKFTNCWSPLMGFATSSPKSCINTLSSNMLDFSPMSKLQDPLSESTDTGGAAKKPKLQPSSAVKADNGFLKVRKEKLGDRITALHRLVSPFGKTDTASVLLEAIGYIQFLQKQIEALSKPCLGRGSGSMRQHHAECDAEPKQDLRSRGLCLVPISCTLHVGNDNGADYWAPAFGANFR